LTSNLAVYELNNIFIKKGIPAPNINLCWKTFSALTEKEVIKIFQHSEIILEKTIEIATTDTRGQGHISSYDATFHAIALLENAILITADAKHFRKTKDLIGSVILLENWSFRLNRFCHNCLE